MNMNERSEQCMGNERLAMSFKASSKYTHANERVHFVNI